MISYDSYKNRIEKLAKAKRIIHKFRFLIMGALAVLIGGSVGLMLAKGTYMSEMSLPEKVEFNQPYEVTPAKAFLASSSSQKVEFSSDQSEWDTEKPQKVGKYYARTVSPKISGYSYSAPVEFEITPIAAEFNITGSSITYGDVPQCEVTNLISGHRVDKESLSFIYSDYTAAESDVSVDTSSFKIVDGSGDDFTSCYDVTFNSKHLTVGLRPIKVKAAEYVAVYNGKGLKNVAEADEDTLSFLANGDTMEIKTHILNGASRVESVVDVGSYGVEIYDVTIKHGELDVTDRYDKTFLNSVFRIDKCPVSVETSTEQRIFDNKPHSGVVASCIGVADGHEYVIDSQTSLTFAGKKEDNIISISIKDAAGKDVTDNYDINYTYGTLEVIPCELFVTTATDSKIYDGNPFENYYYQLKAVYDGFDYSYIPSDEASITDVGNIENKFAIMVSDSATGEDLSENFTINYTYGTLTVDKRPLKVTTADGEWTFNGEYMSKFDFTDSEELTGFEYYAVENDTARILNCGEVGNKFAIGVTDADGMDATDNFDIEYVYGSLKINPLHITVYTDSDSWEYNGEAHSNGGYTAEWEGMSVKDALIGEDKLTALTVTELTNALTVDNVCTYSLPTFDGENSNYIIDETQPGQLTVTPRPIVIRNNDAERVYNAQPLTETGYTTRYDMDGSEETGLLGEDALTVDESVQPAYLTNVGQIPNECKFVLPTFDGEHSNYVERYENMVLNGWLKVTVRNIIVYTGSGDHVYDGTPFGNPDYEKTVWADNTEESGLLGEDKLTLISNPSFSADIVGGPYDNTCGYIVPNNNYKIVDYVYGTINILPRPIMVITADETKTYNGLPLSSGGITVKFAVYDEATDSWLADDGKPGLVVRKDGHKDTLEIDCELPSVTDVGSKTNEFTVVNRDGLNGMSNYDIHYTYGTLTVETRKLTVTTNSDTKVYDGTPLSNDGYTTHLFGDSGERGLIGEDKLTLTGEALSVTNWGEIENICAYSLPLNADGVSNYEIAETVYGKLTIEQRHITVEVTAAEKVYDGTPLSSTEYETLWAYYTGDGDKTGLIEPDELVIDTASVPSITDVTEVQNAFDFTLPEFEEGKSNYVLDETVYNNLKVTARPVIVVTPDLTKKYDGEALVGGGEEIFLAAYDEATGKWVKTEGVGVVERDEATFVRDEAYAIPSVTNVNADSPIDNEIHYKHTNSLGGSNYDIHYSYGTLTVEKRPVTVNIDDKETTYGYLTLPENSFRIADGEQTELPNGEKLELTYKYLDGEDTVDPPVNAKEYVIAKDTEAIAGGNADIGNYDFTYNNGKLTINQKKITVTFAAATNVYGETTALNTYTIADKDGNALVNGSLPNAECGYNEELTFRFKYTLGETSTLTPVNAGTYSVTVDGAFINGTTDGVANYDIIYDYADATLEITKKSVTLTIDNMQWQYGEYYNKDLPETHTFEFATGDGLVGDQQLTVYIAFFKGESKVTPKERGTYAIRATGYAVSNGGETEESKGLVLTNYDITANDGELEIVKRVIKVEVQPSVKTYGETIEKPKFKVTIAVDGEDTEYALPYGEELTYITKYVLNGTDVETPRNAGVYDVEYVGAKKGEAEPGDYDITGVGSTLTINKKDIKIRLDDKAERVYGEAIPETLDYYLVTADGEVRNGNLEYNEQLTVNVSYAPTPVRDVREYTASAEMYTVKGNGDDEQSDGELNLTNYNIECADGKLNVTKRPVKFSLLPIEDVTYGETFVYLATSGNFVLEDGTTLAPGEELTIGVKYSADGVNFNTAPEKAGKYTATYDITQFEITDAESGATYDGVANYEFTLISEPEVEIFKRDISITVHNFTETNGKAIRYGDFKRGEYGTFAYPDAVGNYEGATSLQYGEQLKIAIKYQKDDTDCEPSKVGSYAITLKDMQSFEVYDRDGNPKVGGKDNYNLVQVNEGQLDIVARPITVALNDLSDIVYGEEFAYDDEIGNYKSIDDIAYGEKLKVTVKYVKDGADVAEPRNVGVYDIVIDESVTVLVYDADDNPVEGGIGNYAPAYIKGELEIISKHIQVIVDDIEPISYGADIPAITYGIYHIDGNGQLVVYNPSYDDKITAHTSYQSGGTDVVPKDVATYDAVVKRVDVNGEPSPLKSDEHNYYIEVVNKTLEIVPAELRIQLSDITADYGDSWDYENKIGNYKSQSGLCHGEKLKVTAVTYGGLAEGVKPTDKGEYAIAIVSGGFEIYNADGTPCAAGIANYDLKVEDGDNGKLTINQKKITVTFAAATNVYGETTALNMYTIADKDGNALVNGSLPNAECGYDEELMFRFKYTLGETSTLTPVNAGTYSVTVDGAFINGATDGVANYDISYDYTDATLEITKKSVTLTIDNMQWQYGEYYNKDLPETHTFEFATGDGLVGDQLLTVYIAFFKGESKVTPKERGTYAIRATGYAVSNGGETEESKGLVLTNYDITANDGELEIVKRDVEIVISDFGWTYGEHDYELVNGKYQIKSNDAPFTLPYGDDELFEIGFKYRSKTDNTDYAEPKDADSYIVIIASHALDGSQEQFDANYNLIYRTAATLTISPRPLTVEIDDVSCVYGEEIPTPAYRVTVGNVGDALPYGDKLELTFDFGGAVNFGSYAITVDSAEITDGRKRIENYVQPVNYTFSGDGKANIGKKPITVKINDGLSCIYGETIPEIGFIIYDDNGVELTNGRLPNAECGYNEELEIEYLFTANGKSTTSPTAAAVYSLSANRETVTGGNNSVANYDISYWEDGASFVIEQRELTVTLNAPEIPVYTYGDRSFMTVIAEAETNGKLTGDTVIIALKYEAAPVAHRMRAAAFARAIGMAEAFIPVNAGNYIASLDWDNCEVVDAEGNPVEGGINNYTLAGTTQSVAFTIAPLKTEVRIDRDVTKTYGAAMPQFGFKTYDMSGKEIMLPYGEKLTLDYTFMNGDAAVDPVVEFGEYAICGEVKGVTGGNASLDNYEFVSIDEGGKAVKDGLLTVTAKSVGITLISDTVAFNSGYSYPDSIGNYEAANGLVEGDELKVRVEYKKRAGGLVTGEVIENPVDVGEYAMLVKDFELYRNGVKVDGGEKNYTINIIYGGTLKITELSIRVETGSAEKIYDGEALTCGEFTVLDTLLEGYAVVIDKLCERVDVTSGDGVDNAIKFKVTYNGAESDNYAVETTCGKLKVNARPIIVTTADAAKVYDGNTLSKPDGYTTVLAEERDGVWTAVEGKFGLTEKDKNSLNILSVTEVKNVTATPVDNECDYSPKSANYEIVDIRYGKLTITARHITVVTNDNTFTYNDEDFSDAGYITYLTANKNEFGLTAADGNSLTVLSFTAVHDATPEDITGNNVCVYEAPAYDGEHSNYVIDEVRYGTLKVLRREIKIKTGGTRGVYNDEPYSTDKFELISGTLAGEPVHTIAVDVLFERVDATDAEGVDNTTTFKVMKGATDVTDNYKTEYEYGKIIVEQKKITVATGDIIGETYNGSYHSTEWKKVISGALVSGHTLKLRGELFKQLDATGDSGVKNETYYDVVRSSDESKILTHNYKIDYSFGTIVINRANLTIVLPDDVAVKYGDTDYAARIGDRARVEGLIGDEKFEIALTYGEGVTPKDVDSYTATLDWSACKVIRNGKFDDVTRENYTVDTDSVTSVTFAIEAKALTVTVAKVTNAVYGDAYSVAYTVGETGYNEKLALTFNYTKDGETVTSARFEGTYEVGIADKTLTAADGSAAKPENYDITVTDNSPKLVISPKTVNITPKSFTADYDDTVTDYPVGNGNYISSDALVDGDEMEITVYYLDKNNVRYNIRPQFAGTYAIKLDGYIVTRDGVATENDTNYTVNEAAEGTLTINGVRLVVTLKTVEKIYDGTPLTLNSTATADEVSISYTDAAGAHTELPEGFTLKLAEAISTDGARVQSKANTADYVVYEGETPSAEYDVEVVRGDAKLVISQRPILITTADAEKVYDGDALSKTDGYTVKYAVFDGASWTADEGKTGLVDGDTLKLTYTAKITDCNFGEVKNACEYENSNYDIHYSYGNLTVTQRHIKVTSASKSFVYDGEAHSDGSYTSVWSDDESKTGTVGSDKLVLVSAATVTNVDDTSNNVCVYEAPKFDGEHSNYVIDSVSYGKLTVTPRSIAVVTPDGSWEYDGKSHSKTEGVTTHLKGDTSKKGLVKEDESLTLVGNAATITNVGTADNVCVFTVPNNNYVIEDGGYEYGTLEVTPKAATVTITLDGSEFEYGDATFADKFTFAISGLVENEEVTTKKVAYGSAETPKNVGTYTATFDDIGSVCSIAPTNTTGIANGIGNYTFTSNTVTFEIVKREITLELSAWANETYNGKQHNYSGTCTPTDGTQFYYGDRITDLIVTYNATPVAAATYTVTLDAAASKVGELSLDHNYTVTCAAISFTIDKAPLKVTMTDQTFVYDGQPHEFTQIKFEGLCEGDEIEKQFTYTATTGGSDDLIDAGTYDVEFDSSVLDGLSNYELDTVNSRYTATLTVNKRSVSVKVASKVVERENVSGDGATDGTYTVADIIVTGETGFVEGDLKEGCAEFAFSEIPVDGFDYRKFEVSVSFVTVDGYDIYKNYNITVDEQKGELTLTQKWVKVSVNVITNEMFYTGSPVADSNFEIVSAHPTGNGGGIAADDLAAATKIFTFTDANGNAITAENAEDFPKDAGVYKVTVTLSGDSLKNYYIEYSAEEVLFTIKPRKLNFEFTRLDGGTGTEFSHVYDKDCPDLENLVSYTLAENTEEGYGFANGEGTSIELKLINSDNMFINRYNVGKYTIAVYFEGIGNYELYFNVGYTLTIAKRTVIIVPRPVSLNVDYDGNDVTLGPRDYEIVSDVKLAKGDEATGDDAVIAEADVLALPAVAKNLRIVRMKFFDKATGEDLTENYNALIRYSSSNAEMKALGLGINDFEPYVSYNKITIEYNQKVSGKAADGNDYAYDGNKITHSFDTDKAVEIVNGALASGHVLKFSASSVSKGPNAGIYADWLTSLIKVDANGKDASALYKFVCLNARDEGNPIVIKKLSLTVTVNSLDVAAEKVDGADVLAPVGYTVTDDEGNAVTSPNVNVYKLTGADGAALLGVAVYTVNGASRTSVVKNYDVTIDTSAVGGVAARTVELNEVNKLLLPYVKVVFNTVVTADNLYDNCTYDAVRGEWVLNSGVYSYNQTELAANDHKVKVVVYKKDGSYMLGVVIYYSKEGTESDAASKYNLAPVEGNEGGLEVTSLRYPQSEMLTRDLIVDLSGYDFASVETAADIENPSTLGLITTKNHVAKVRVEKTAEGNYTVYVSVTNDKDVLMGRYYDVVVKAPAGVTVTVRSDVKL